MGALFVSDVHLCVDRPHLTQAFLDFLAAIGPDCTELYILGDLFDRWIGDDDAGDPGTSIATALRQLDERGIQVSLMPGNRDFLLGERFARRAGATLLEDPFLIRIDGRAVLLTHGDALCSDDRSYQRYRAIARNPLSRGLFLALPLALRRRLAERLRQRSAIAIRGKSEQRMDAVPVTAQRLMDAHGAAILIHGHTHRPQRHQHDGGLRFVTGDWQQHAWYLDWPSGAEPQLRCLDLE